MKIEVLYSPGCPNYLPAVERIRRVLSSESLQEEIRSIAVRTDAAARELMFSSSPTVRVNGEDVESIRQMFPVLPVAFMQIGAVFLQRSCCG
jgi:hypothetical protein